MTTRASILTEKKTAAVRNTAVSTTTDTTPATPVTTTGRTDMTELCRLIGLRDFRNAIGHLHKRPEEAKVWTFGSTVDKEDDQEVDGGCHDDDDTSGYRRRRHQQQQQLPLHLACQMLRSEDSGDSDSGGRDSDSEAQRQPQHDMVLLYHLIERLVVLYPDACKERDHDDDHDNAGAGAGRDGSDRRNGLLPLEQVIANHPRTCPPRLLEIIIAAYPEASLSSRSVQYLAEEDEDEDEDSGSNNANERKRRKRVLTDMLRRAQNAVIQSRQDAKLRFLYHHDSPVDSGVVVESASPSSTNVSEAESLLVQDLYRRHDTYGKTILDLTRERLELQNEMHRLRSVAKDEKRILHEEKLILYHELDDINSDLRRQIARMELALRDNGLDCDGNSFVDATKAGATATNSSNQAGVEKMSMMGMDPEVATPLTKYLENKVNELSEELGDKEDENDQLCLEVEELQSLVRNLRRRQQSGSLDNTTFPEIDDTTPFSTPPRSINAKSELESDELNDKKETGSDSQDGSHVCVDDENGDGDNPHVQVAGAKQEESSTAIEELKEELRSVKGANRSLSERQDQLEEMVKGLESKTMFRQFPNSAESNVMLSKMESFEDSEVAGSTVSKGDEGRNCDPTKTWVSDGDSNGEIVKISSASQEEGDDQSELVARVAELEEQLRLANQQTVEKDGSHEQEVSKLKKRLVDVENENALLYQYNQHEDEASDSESEDMSLPFDTETIGDSEGEENNASMNASRETSLGKKLSVVDQISGHESTDDEEGSVSTPYTARSMAVSIAHSSVQNESESSLDVPEHPGPDRLSGESSSRGGSVSLSSWGALSFSRTPTRRSKSKRKGKRNPLPQNKSRGENSQQSVENLEECFGDDNLEGNFANAATLYHENDGPDVDNTSNDGMFKIEQPNESMIDDKKSFNSPKSNPLAETARLVAASEEIIDIVDHTENLLGYELSSELFEVLQDTALDMVRTGQSHTTTPESERPDLSFQQVSGLIIDYSLIDAVEKTHVGTLQPDVVSSLRASAQWHIEHCHNELQSADAMKERLEEELLDALIELSEQTLNNLFPEDLVNALKTAALSFDSLLIDKLDETNHHSISIDFQVLEDLFKKAEDIYASNFPESILLALRDAGSILQSRLDGIESQCESDSTSEGKIEESLEASADTTESDENLIDIDGDIYDVPLQEEDGSKLFNRKTVQRKPSMSDMSKASTSEVSLDLFAVFDSTNKPPKASAAVSVSKRVQNETEVSTDAIPKVQNNQSFAHTMDKRPVTRKISRRSNSADGALQTMADTLKMKSGLADPSHEAGSDDLDLIFKHATKGGVASASTISQHYTSDFSSTLMSSKISSTLMSSVGESTDSFVSSTHIHRSRAAGAILTSIITDTEETYGVHVPPDLVRAIKTTIPYHVSDTFSVISVVKPLHTDSFWEATEKIYGKPIQRDLIAAICLTFPSDDTQAKIIPSYSCPDSEDDTLHSNYTRNFVSEHLRNELLSPTKSISMHSDNSWSKLTVAFSERKTRSLETGKGLQTESENNTDSRSTADLSARERKRIAEAKFANSLADFDFDFSVREVFNHAKETLDMYSPQNSGNRKTHNEMVSADEPNVDVSINEKNERQTESPLPDNLEDLYKSSYLQSPRGYDSAPPPPNVSPPRPPDFSSVPKEAFTEPITLSDNDNEELPSDDPPEIQKTAIMTNGDPLLNVADGKEDDLKNLYQKASAIQHSTTGLSDADAANARKSQTAPNSYFVRSKAERSNSLDDHTDKAPLSSFLELNRTEMLERTQSGREILAISPVTEPTLGNEYDPKKKEEVRAKLRSFNYAIPDLEQAIERAADSDIETTDLAETVGAALEDRSLDTAGELQRIISVVEDKYGTRLSHELIEAINNSEASETGRVATMNDSNQSSLVMNSIGIDREIESGNSSLGPNVLSTELQRIEDLSMLTKWTVQEYLDALIHNAECHLENPDQVQEIADDLCDAVRGVCARTKMMIVWEDLESILQKLCDGHDEDFWFEIQEAFFKAWEMCADPKQRQKLARMGHASGYFSATTSASDGSISVLMNSSFDFDPLLDIIDEVRKLNNGQIPDELLKQMKEDSLAAKGTETKEAIANLEYSTDLSTSKTSIGEANGQSMSFDYSQSTVSSGSSVPPMQIQNTQEMDDSGAFSAWTREEDDEQKALEHDQTQNLPKESVIGRSFSHCSQSSQSGHSVTVNRFMGPSILREVRKVYPQPIPDELVSVLQNSPSLPYSMNSDEDISIILEEFKSLSGQQLAADLILGLREASVALRTPSNPRQARRFRLSRQNSASSSFRSRTSGMPSIQESGSTSSVSPSSSTHHKTFSSESSVDTPSTRFMPPRRRDSVDPGLPETFLPEKIDPAVKTTSTTAGVDGMATTETDDVSEGSLGAHSDHSLNIPTIFTNPSPQTTPTSSGELHESTATQLVSNTYCRPAHLVSSDLATVLSNSVDSESIDNTFESNENAGNLKKRTLSEVSWEPAIPSTQKIPIDTEVSPPVDCAQSDDLDELFRVAAGRMR